MSKAIINNDTHRITEDADADHIYYNISIKANEINKGIATFSENRVQPIVECPNEYELAVVRFNIPGTQLPIFLWRDGFKITFSYDGSDFTNELQFIPNTPGGSYDWYGQAIWSYQDFIDTINAGFLACFNDFVAGTPAFTGKPTNPPFMSLDHVTSLCSIYAPVEYDSSVANPVKIYFNPLLQDNFPSFQNIQTADPIKSKQIIINSNYGLDNITLNSIDYIKVEQEFSSLFLWTDLFNILFETNSIPVSTENLASQTNKTRRIITDFEPLQDINNRSSIQFYPQGPLRWYDLESNQPLRRIDLNILWSTKEGDIFPLRMNATDELSIKLEFRRKAAYGDY